MEEVIIDLFLLINVCIFNMKRNMLRLANIKIIIDYSYIIYQFRLLITRIESWQYINYINV